MTTSEPAIDSVEVANEVDGTVLVFASDSDADEYGLTGDEALAAEVRAHLSMPDGSGP